MADEWDDDTPAVATAWDDEDDDGDTMDNWDDDEPTEEEVAKKKADDAAAAALAEAEKKKKKKSWKAKAEAKERRLDDEEDEEEVEAESEEEKRRRLQREQEASELEFAKDTFGVGSEKVQVQIKEDPLAAFVVRKKADFIQFEELLLKKILPFQEKSGYDIFVEQLMRGLCSGQSSEMMKNLGKILTVMTNEKQKEEKGPVKKSKKRSGPKKVAGFSEEAMGNSVFDDEINAEIAAELAEEEAANADDYYDDFM